MKKLLLLLLVVFIPSIVQAQHGDKLTTTLLAEYTFRLDSGNASTSFTLPGRPAFMSFPTSTMTTGTRTFHEFKTKKIELYTEDSTKFFFVLEIESDSIKVNKWDSVEVYVKFQPLTLSGLPDSSTWNSWTTLITKLKTQPLSVITPSTMTPMRTYSGNLWISLKNCYPTTRQNGRIRVWVIRTSR